MLTALLSSLNITVILSGIILLALSYLYVITKRGKALPPGPPCYPFLGNLGQFDPEQGLIDYRKLRKQYGDVFTLMVGSTPMIIVNGMKAMREILIGKADITSERYPITPVKLLSKGHGIVSSNGHIWKEQRTFALTTLRSFGYGKTSADKPILEEIQVFLKNIEKTNGKPFDPQDTILVSVANNICSLLFGKRYEHDDKAIIKLLHIIYETMKILGLNSIINYLPFLRHLPGDFFHAKRLLKEQEEFTAYIEGMVEEHRSTLDETNPRDYVDCFLIAQKQRKDDESTTFTDKQLLETVRDFFFAGTDTTSTSLRWSVLFMAVYQDVQAKIKEEIDNVVGNDRLPEMNDKPNMPYCEAVMNELLRLGNVSPLGLPHGTKEDFYYNGYLIPKNAVIIPNLDSLAIDPEVFEDPYKFNPDRYLNEKGQVTGKDRHAPFSVGRRSCAGEHFAKIEVFLFLTAMVQQFQFSLVGPQPSFEGNLGLTRTPDKFEVRAVKRVKSS